MKNVPVFGKIGFLAALIGVLSGGAAYLFFDQDSESYEILISIFKIMWAAWFILYVLTFAVYLGGGRSRDNRKD